MKGAPWFDKVGSLSACIVGAGGIGSWLSLFLARAGLKPIYLIDDDYVEEHNLGGQLFSGKSVGHRKVTAMFDLISELVPHENNVYPVSTLYSSEEAYKDCDVICMAVDNMKARKQVVQDFVTSNAKFLIDGRLELEHLIVYPVRKSEAQAYLDSLPDDKDIPDVDCTVKQTSDVAAGIAFFMTRVICNAAAEYVVPRKIELYIPAFFFEVKK